MTSLRARLSDGLFAMVAGPEGPAARDRIHSTPGPRWFPVGSPIQRVHADTSMYVGGLRALLLQSLHPLAMAAVDDFSDFRHDVWGRLARTSTFLAETTFAAADDAERAVAVVRAVHKHIKGTAPDGRPYRADDPHLLTWVHVAEVDSFLTAHQLFGAAQLTPDECDTYVAQAAVVATKLGASDVPVTHDELRARLEDFRSELASTPAALDVVRFLITDAPVPRPARPPYALLVRSAAATLPRWAREPLHLPDRPLVDRTAWRAAGHVSTRGLRWLSAAQEVPSTPTTQDVATDQDATTGSDVHEQA